MALPIMPAFSSRVATDETVSPSFTVKLIATPGSPDGFKTRIAHQPSEPSKSTEAASTIVRVRKTPPRCRNSLGEVSRDSSDTVSTRSHGSSCQLFGRSGSPVMSQPDELGCRAMIATSQQQQLCRRRGGVLEHSSFVPSILDLLLPLSGVRHEHEQAHPPP